MSMLKQMVHEIDDLIRENEELHFEVIRLQRYEEMYHELLGQSAQHNANMLGGLLQLSLKMAENEASKGPGVAA